MKRMLLILSLTFLRTICGAQCRQWFGEQVSKVNDIIDLIQPEIPVNLIFDSLNSKTSFVHGADSRLTYIYSDTLKGHNVAHINVKIRYEAADTLIGTQYSITTTSLRSVTIDAPAEWIRKIGESFKKTISDCIVNEGKLYVLFGKDKNNTDRLLINGSTLSLSLTSGLERSKL